ncbi:hypothetical protein BDO18943_05452 [Burkholderia dolosa]|nr:hypothetical protein BDO18943_05452 [Burkholderia dolosa]
MPRGTARGAKPVELVGASFREKAALYIQSQTKNIRKEILFILNNGKGAINDNGQKIYLKALDKPNEFITHHPDAVNPKTLERRVVVDPETLSWRYADDFDASGLNVEVLEGKNQIKLHGDYYEVVKNSDQNFEAVVRKDGGVKEYVSVYMEPLSGTWHLRVRNGRPAFNSEQAAIISQAKVQMEPGFRYVPRGNNNEKYYGAGKIYVQEQIDDFGHYPWGRYIEMSGELVPVRNVQREAPGVLYEVYNLNNPDSKGYPVEWDGDRWLFERETSVHVSDEVASSLKHDAPARDIEAKKLSSPDGNGLRWSNGGRSYIKAHDNFFEVSPSTQSDGHYIVAGSRKIKIEYRKNQWYKAATAPGFPEQLNYFPGESAVVTAYCNDGYVTAFKVDSTKTLTENLFDHFSPIDDGEYIYWKNRASNKPDLFSINKITLDRDGHKASIYYPRGKNRCPSPDILFNDVPVNFGQSGKILVSPEDYDIEFKYISSPYDMHVMRQGTIHSCGYTSAAMVAKDLQHIKNISPDVVSRYVSLRDEGAFGVFSTSLSERMAEDGISNRLVDVEDPVAYIQEKMRKNEWMGIANIDGHFCVVSRADENSFYLRDPYQGILFTDKIDKLKEYDMGRDIIEIDI